jgi:hypothetical protein
LQIDVVPSANNAKPMAHFCETEDRTQHPVQGGAALVARVGCRAATPRGMARRARVAGLTEETRLQPSP